MQRSDGKEHRPQPASLLQATSHCRHRHVVDYKQASPFWRCILVLSYLHGVKALQGNTTQVSTRRPPRKTCPLATLEPYAAQICRDEGKVQTGNHTETQELAQVAAEMRYARTLLATNPATPVCYPHTPVASASRTQSGRLLVANGYTVAVLFYTGQSSDTELCLQQCMTDSDCASLSYGNPSDLVCDTAFLVSAGVTRSACIACSLYDGSSLCNIAGVPPRCIAQLQCPPPRYAALIGSNMLCCRQSGLISAFCEHLVECCIDAKRSDTHPAITGAIPPLCVRAMSAVRMSQPQSS